MTIEFNNQVIETTDNGYLVSIDDWSESLATHMASQDSVSLSDRHWDVIHYLRDEYLNNGGNQPNTRALLKEMGIRWNTRLKSKDLYDLFPGDPSKQGGRIAGLPESRRKGGY